MEHPDSPKAALQEAISLAGDQPTLAAELTKVMSRKVTQQNVSSWLHRRQRPVDGEIAIAIEKVTGVSRHRLNPAAYPMEVP